MKSQLLSMLTAGAIAFAPGYALAQADTLTSVDRTRMVRELEESNQHFLAAINGLSEAQWRFKPAPTRWSIAEVAEHLALVDQGIGGAIRTQQQSTFGPPRIPSGRGAGCTRHLEEISTPRTGWW
jgi:hypothetical protein